MSMHISDMTTVVAHWPEMSARIFVPHTEREYRQLVAFLDQLIDEIGEDEIHP